MGQKNPRLTEECDNVPSALRGWWGVASKCIFTPFRHL